MIGCSAKNDNELIGGSAVESDDQVGRAGPAVPPCRKNPHRRCGYSSHFNTPRCNFRCGSISFVTSDKTQRERLLRRRIHPGHQSSDLYCRGGTLKRCWEIAMRC